MFTSTVSSLITADPLHTFSFLKALESTQCYKFLLYLYVQRYRESCNFGPFETDRRKGYRNRILNRWKVPRAPQSPLYASFSRDNLCFGFDSLRTDKGKQPPFYFSWCTRGHYNWTGLSGCQVLKRKPFSCAQSSFSLIKGSHYRNMTT